MDHFLTNSSTCFHEAMINMTFCEYWIIWLTYNTHMMHRTCSADFKLLVFMSQIQRVLGLGVGAPPPPFRFLVDIIKLLPVISFYRLISISWKQTFPSSVMFYVYICIVFDRFVFRPFVLPASSCVRNTLRVAQWNCKNIFMKVNWNKDTYCSEKFNCFLHTCTLVHIFSDLSCDIGFYIPFFTIITPFIWNLIFLDGLITFSTQTFFICFQFLQKNKDIV